MAQLQLPQEIGIQRFQRCLETGGLGAGLQNSRIAGLRQEKILERERRSHQDQKSKLFSLRTQGDSVPCLHSGPREPALWLRHICHWLPVARTRIFFSLFSQKMSDSYTVTFKSWRERRSRAGMCMSIPAILPGDCQHICISDLHRHSTKLLEGVSLHIREGNLKN